MIENEDVKKAEEELEYLSGEANERRMAELRQKAIWDEASARYCGVQEGLEEGERNNKIETAKRMLAAGCNVEFIIQITDLTKEEIENL